MGQIFENKLKEVVLRTSKTRYEIAKELGFKDETALNKFILSKKVASKEKLVDFSLYLKKNLGITRAEVDQIIKEDCHN